jgi:transcriptional regulatory protein LEU3
MGDSKARYFFSCRSSVPQIHLHGLTSCSKLEELAQELRTIKEAVAPTSRQDFIALRATEQPSPRAVQPPLSLPPVTSILSGPAFQSKVQEPPITDPPTFASFTSHTSPAVGRSSQPRVLALRVFPVAEVDHYFEKYFEAFHGYLPIVRNRDPDTVYNSSTLLFWVIITTACRRYAKDDQVYPFLIENLAPEIAAVVAHPPLRLPSINALLILAAWPLPTMRLMADPSSMYTGLAMNACFILGLHTGKGNQPEFRAPRHDYESSDEEATYTWAGCNVVSARIASYAGFPCAAPPTSKIIDRLLNGTSYLSVSSCFAVQMSIARFSNRVHRTMAAAVEESEGVSQHLVAQLEDEWAGVQRQMRVFNSSLESFMLLTGLLEVQSYYFLPLAGYGSETFKLNMARCYATARNILQLVLQLEADIGFLTHSPHFIARHVLLAGCIIITIATTTFPEMAADDVEELLVDLRTALQKCSVQDTDLPIRATKMFESYWTIRKTYVRPDLDRLSTSGFSHRIGSGLVFDCLRRWMYYIAEAPKTIATIPNGVEAGQEVLKDPGELTGMAA